MVDENLSPNHVQSQPERKFSLSDSLAPCRCGHDPANLTRVADDLGDDRTLLAAIEMAVLGLGEEYDCQGTAAAVAELVRCLQQRLDERAEHIHELVVTQREAVQ